MKTGLNIIEGIISINIFYTGFRYMRTSVLAIILIIVCSSSGFSQIVHEQGYPAGLSEGTKSISWLSLNITDEEINELREDAANSKDQLPFAISREVNLNPTNSGLITENKGGLNTWHTFISSQDASSLALCFSSFRLQPGERVFIYDPGMNNVLGPFTSKNNKESGILPVIPLAGSQLIVEYQYLKNGSGELEVGQVGHDALGIFGSLSQKDEDFGSSGLCNVDINCDYGDEWSDEKRAIVKLLIVDTEVFILGTGTLVNNTAYDNIPYILTAEHVLNNSLQASGTIAIFNYESPWCGGPDGRISKSISGAELIATNSDIDATLIELSEFPPILYKPYMAGWDIRGNIPPNTCCIHHPSGDVKKITLDFDEPLIGTYPAYLQNGFWNIIQWDVGTTEGGSSGSPLFDNNHKIIGLLTGGQATCGNSVNDYYARLDIAFTISQNSNNSLKPWLDNKNIGKTVLEGRDPYKDNLTTSDTLFNGVDNEYYLTSYDGGKTGLSSGFNSDSLIAYAEKFHLDSRKEITDVLLYIGSSNYVSADDSVSLFILDDNGGPGNVIASERIKIKETKDDFLFRADFANPVPVIGTFYIAYQNWYKETAESELRQFAVYHGSAPLPGSDFAWFRDKDGWKPFSQHPFSPGENTLYIKAVVVDSSKIVSIGKHNYDEIDILIYPNPADDYLILKSAGPEIIIQSAAITDLSGKILRSYSKINSNILTIDKLQNLKPGIYLIEIVASGRSHVYKFVKGDSR
jgi:hypothetical protein